VSLSGRVSPRRGRRGRTDPGQHAADLISRLIDHRGYKRRTLPLAADEHERLVAASEGTAAVISWWRHLTIVADLAMQDPGKVSRPGWVLASPGRPSHDTGGRWSIPAILWLRPPPPMLVANRRGRLQFVLNHEEGAENSVYPATPPPRLFVRDHRPQGFRCVT